MCPWCISHIRLSLPSHACPQSWIPFPISIHLTLPSPSIQLRNPLPSNPSHLIPIPLNQSRPNIITLPLLQLRLTSRFERVRGVRFQSVSFRLLGLIFRVGRSGRGVDFS